MDLDDTREAATQMLAAIVDQAATLDVELPDRQFANVGGVVHDCEQVSVSALSLSLGLSAASGSPEQTGAVAFPCDPIWQIRVEFTIVRCAAAVPQNVSRGGTTAVSVEKYDADLTAASRDVAVMAAAVQSLASAAGIPTMEVTFAQPQGGLISATMAVTMNLWF